MSRHHLAAVIEEMKVEGEAHAKGVDAGTAGDEQARAGPSQVELGEAEEAGARPARYPYLAAEDRRHR